MPAIHLDRLKQNSAQLAEQFDHPENFVHNLHKILSNYADLAHRPGQTGEPAPLIFSYYVPKPVIRQILNDVTPRVKSNPDGALTLCDHLWNEPYYEMRLLAASIIGRVTPDPVEPILDRIRKWSDGTSDNQIITVILDQGLHRLRLDAPEKLITQIESWLSDPIPEINRLGIQALIPLIETANYENIPLFFRQISPYVRELPPALRNDVSTVIQILARRSPVETAYFLRQHITSNNTNAAWLTRQNLRDFPADIQISLRELLRTPDLSK